MARHAARHQKTVQREISHFEANEAERAQSVSYTVKI